MILNVLSLLFIFVLVRSFSITPKKTRYLNNQNNNILSMNYKEQMAKAKAMKIDGNSNTRTIERVHRNRSPISSSSSSGGGTTGSPPLDNIDMSRLGKGEKGLPFTDDMYQYMTFSIKTLSDRMKTGEPLTKEEVDKLQTAILSLIMDAKAGANMPIETNMPDKSNNIPLMAVDETTLDSSTSTSSFPQDLIMDISDKSHATYLDQNHNLHNANDERTPFDDVFDGANSWRVPGMETMDTEEYYKAVNSRVKAIKEKRQQKGDLIGQQSVDDYFDHLNASGRR